MLKKTTSVLHGGIKRFSLIVVALVVFTPSFLLFVLNYVYKFIVGEPFNWSLWWEYFPSYFLSTLVTTVFSYFALNYYYYLINQRRRVSHFMLPSMVFLVLGIGYNLLIDYLLPLKANAHNPLPIGKQILSNSIIVFFYIVFVLLIAYVTHLRDERKKHRHLQEQKLKLEVEKAQAELMFLKSQINPHFLHNTLNSFYARSLPLSEDLANGILTLSEMMRYALDHAQTADGKVLLKDEIKHLKNIININQFRFRNNLNVHLEVNGDVNDAVIIPFVLITLVENIFKHGDLTHPAYAIKIIIEVRDGRLKYCSQNRKKTGPKELSTGIGLDNIKKRLDLTYGDKYKLVVKDTHELYTAELIISEL